MTKQRRSFFVDDILHMVMPMDKKTSYPNANEDLKRKRSISAEDGNKNEEVLNKKFRSQDEAEDNNDESNHSQTVDIIGKGETDDDDSCASDNSNNPDDNSGKLENIQ
jgi:hypothetical protein